MLVQRGSGQENFVYILHQIERLNDKVLARRTGRYRLCQVALVSYEVDDSSEDNQQSSLEILVNVDSNMVGEEQVVACLLKLRSLILRSLVPSHVVDDQVLLPQVSIEVSVKA